MDSQKVIAFAQLAMRSASVCCEVAGHTDASVALRMLERVVESLQANGALAFAVVVACKMFRNARENIARWLGL